jgi:tetratricopeptide (TPR) repeat protein
MQGTADGIRVRANALYGAGRLEESELLFRRLADGLDPVEGHHGLGVLALRRGDPDGALHHFHAALLVEPRHANSLYWLGYLAQRDALGFEAFLLYQAALASEPRHRLARAALERLTAAGTSALRADTPPGWDDASGPPAGESRDEPSIGRGMRGTVVELTPFQQQAWNTGRFKQGFNFRLQVPDSSLVEVEIRGQKIYGRLRNGDDVEVLSGFRRRGLVSASRLYNHSSHSEIRRRFI